jgi:hypothetical protein
LSKLPSCSEYLSKLWTSGSEIAAERQIDASSGSLPETNNDCDCDYGTEKVPFSRLALSQNGITTCQNPRFFGNSGFDFRFENACGRNADFICSLLF